MQITAHVVEDGRFKTIELAAGADIPAGAVWIDALDATVEAASDLVNRLGLRLEVGESVRKFDIYGHVEMDDRQLTALLRADRPEGALRTDMRSARIAMLMGQGTLVTLRTGTTPAVEQTARQISGMMADPHPETQILVHILSRAMHVTSEFLDEAEASLRLHAHKLFGASSISRAELDLEKLLSELGPQQGRMVEARYGHRVIIRIVEILQDDPRVALSPETRAVVDSLASDVVSLRDFAALLDDQLARLVDATLGYIGIRQNVSARWFSLVATVFMPPTLLAAIWGMNFQNMPELDEKYAYWIALGAMFLSATVPLWIVRKLGWAGR